MSSPPHFMPSKDELSMSKITAAPHAVQACPIRPAAKLLGSAAALVLLAGCTVTPEPFNHAERAAQVRSDRAMLYVNQDPVNGPVSLEEAIARALNYNLDRRVAVMEQAVQLRQFDLSRFDLLPSVVSEAGYHVRSKEQLSTSRNVAGNLTDPDNASTSLEKRRFIGELGMSWSILDFGVSYYQAKQHADLSLVAVERERRAVHVIVQEVRAAYWRAAAAQRLEGVIKPVLAEARAALDDSRTVERERLRPLLETLRYQRSLVAAVRQLAAIEEELAISKAELARLMNLAPGTAYQLSLPEATNVPQISLSLPEMETLALEQRPELREAAYQSRITALETRKALLKMFPNLNFYGSLNADSNDYLVNQEWAQAGAQVSWNLLNLASAARGKRLRDAQVELTDTRRLAMSMAVLTQVHVSHQQFLRAREQYEQAAHASSIEERIFGTVRTGTQGEAQSVLDRVQAGTAAAAAEFQRDLAYAELQNAYAAVHVSLGFDPLPDHASAHDLQTLSQALRERLRQGPSAPAAHEPASAEAGAAN